VLERNLIRMVAQRNLCKRGLAKFLTMVKIVSFVESFRHRNTLEKNKKTLL